MITGIQVRIAEGGWFASIPWQVVVGGAERREVGPDVWFEVAGFGV